MGSEFWKELDPRGDTGIPGGEDGNDFFFFFFLVWDHVTAGKIDLQGLSSSFVSLTICQDLILSGY